MSLRSTLVILAVFAVLGGPGCGDDEPTAPAPVDTDYEFVVVNNTSIDFEVFRHSSLDKGVWEPMEPIGAWDGMPYLSEIGVTYLLRFCLPGKGPDVWETGVNYTFDSTATEYWVLDYADMQP